MLERLGWKSDGERYECLVILELIFAKWVFSYLSEFFWGGGQWKFLGVKPAQAIFGCAITQADGITRGGEG